jgi:hypothetical protein
MYRELVDADCWKRDVEGAERRGAGQSASSGTSSKLESQNLTVTHSTAIMSKIEKTILRQQQKYTLPTD